jgi:KaiC/GvpD/RAD55 family RecA-like ATPase
MRKTVTGLRFFDDEFGGAYRGRVHLLTARAQGGKTVTGLQFLKRGLELGERGLILSAEAAADLAIHASFLGLNVEEAAVTDNLLLFEYKDYIQGRDEEQNIVLPPEGFQQLSQVIEEEVVSRVVLDTALPWINMGRRTNMQEHVVSLVRAFERLGATTLLTLPKPASPAAQKLRKTIEANVPVAITIDYSPDTGKRVWIVNKYLGSDRSEQSVEIEFKPGTGFDVASEKETEQTGGRSYGEHPEGGSEPSANGEQSSRPSHPAGSQKESGGRQGHDLSFSKVMLSE